MKNRPRIPNPLQDFTDAIYGEGPLKFEWQSHPENLVRELVARLEPVEEVVEFVPLDLSPADRVFKKAMEVLDHAIATGIRAENAFRRVDEAEKGDDIER